MGLGSLAPKPVPEREERGGERLESEERSKPHPCTSHVSGGGGGAAASSHSLSPPQLEEGMGEEEGEEKRDGGGTQWLSVFVGRRRPTTAALGGARGFSVTPIPHPRYREVKGCRDPTGDREILAFVYVCACVSPSCFGEGVKMDRDMGGPGGGRGCGAAPKLWEREEVKETPATSAELNENSYFVLSLFSARSSTRTQLGNEPRETGGREGRRGVTGGTGREERRGEGESPPSRARPGAGSSPPTHTHK